ncbi:MAG TPA: hypothetical protein VJ798_02160 [Rhizomicrobium sp.]|nr:hypothetical protein [Rhizomicrobium sp.]
MAPVHRAFDDLKAAEAEVLRQLRSGHVFQTDTITLREYSRERF